MQHILILLISLFTIAPCATSGSCPSGQVCMVDACGTSGWCIPETVCLYPHSGARGELCCYGTCQIDGYCDVSGACQGCR